MTELIDLLTGAFGSVKTLDQYCGELNIIYSKPGKYVLDYIGRVKDLRIAIFDAERKDRKMLDTLYR